MDGDVDFFDETFTTVPKHNGYSREATLASHGSRDVDDDYGYSYPRSRTDMTTYQNGHEYKPEASQSNSAPSGSHAFDPRIQPSHVEDITLEDQRGDGSSDPTRSMLLLDSALPPQYRWLLPWSRLNAVQSAVFDSVFHSDASVCVAAPTGTGKTTIFELAIIRLMMLRDGMATYRDPGTGAHSSSFPSPNFTGGKVVYLAPLKALASEKYKDWAARFSPAGLSVVCCTGDDGVGEVEGAAVDAGAGAGGGADDEGGSGGGGKGMSAADTGKWLSRIRGADIVVTTPEKWDAITRRWTDNTGLIGSIALLAVDEVHLLGEDRGAALEAVVSRMRTVSGSSLMKEKGWPASCLRIVALSATLPNLHDVARWIGAGPGSTFEFDESYRPVRLQKMVMPYSGYGSGQGGGGGGSAGGVGPNGFMFEKYLDTRVAEVVAAHSRARPTLIFCASRNAVRACAEQLVKDAPRFNIRGTAIAMAGAMATGSASAAAVAAVGWHKEPGSAAICAEVARTVKDGRLAECLRRGVGYHSAGACMSDRAAVESLFLGNNLPVLCTTTTLAMGVNLPAHLVIVKSTQAWRGAGQGYKEYPKSTLLQMMGRAGRPQFDTSGTAVIMTHTSTAHIYRDMASGADAIESSLAQALVEHLASEICLDTVTTTTSAQEWLRSTFFFIRMTSAVVENAEASSASGTTSARAAALASAVAKYYHLPAGSAMSRLKIVEHCRQLLSSALFALASTNCIRIEPASHVDCTYIAPAKPAVEAASSSAGGVLSASGQVSAGTKPRGSLARHGGWMPATAADLREGFSDGNVLSFRALGPAHVMVRHYLRFETLRLFSTLPKEATVPDALAHLCHAAELTAVTTLRRDEKRILREVKEKHGRALVGPKKTAGKITDVSDKVLCLAWASLGRVVFSNSAPEPASSSGKVGEGKGALNLATDRNVAAGSQSFALRMETSAVMDLLTRISKALVAWTVCDDIQSSLAPVASRLARAIANKTWHDAAPGRLMLQLEGVTEAAAFNLASIGAASIESLQGAAFTAAALQAACRRQHPWGQQLKAQAFALLPRLGLEVAQVGMCTDGGPAALLRVTVTEQSQSAPAIDDGTHAQRSMVQYMVKKGDKGAGASRMDDGEAGDASGSDNETVAVTARRTGKAHVAAVPGADPKLAPKHWYALALTTSDVDGGLVFYKAYLRRPASFTVRVPRPKHGPVVLVTLMHGKFLGLDSSVTFQAGYPFTAPIKGVAAIAARATGLLKDTSTHNPIPKPAAHSMPLTLTDMTAPVVLTAAQDELIAGFVAEEVDGDVVLVTSHTDTATATAHAAPARAIAPTAAARAFVPAHDGDEEDEFEVEEAASDSDDGFIRRKKTGKIKLTAKARSDTAASHLVSVPAAARECIVIDDDSDERRKSPSMDVDNGTAGSPSSLVVENPIKQYEFDDLLADADAEMAKVEAVHKVVNKAVQRMHTLGQGQGQGQARPSASPAPLMAPLAPSVSSLPPPLPLHHREYSLVSTGLDAFALLDAMMSGVAPAIAVPMPDNGLPHSAAPGKPMAPPPAQALAVHRQKTTGGMPSAEQREAQLAVQRQKAAAAKAAWMAKHRPSASGTPAASDTVLVTPPKAPVGSPVEVSAAVKQVPDMPAQQPAAKASVHVGATRKETVLTLLQKHAVAASSDKRIPAKTSATEAAAPTVSTKSKKSSAKEKSAKPSTAAVASLVFASWDELPQSSHAGTEECSSSGEGRDDEASPIGSYPQVLAVSDAPVRHSHALPSAQSSDQSANGLSCSHKCRDMALCGHECCRAALVFHMQERARMSTAAPLPPVSSSSESSNSKNIDLEAFKYVPGLGSTVKVKPSGTAEPAVPVASDTPKFARRPAAAVSSSPNSGSKTRTQAYAYPALPGTVQAAHRVQGAPASVDRSMHSASKPYALATASAGTSLALLQAKSSASRMSTGRQPLAGSVHEDGATPTGGHDSVVKAMTFDSFVEDTMAHYGGASKGAGAVDAQVPRFSLGAAKVGAFGMPSSHPATAFGILGRFTGGGSSQQSLAMPVAPAPSMAPTMYNGLSRLKSGPAPDLSMLAAQMATRGMLAAAAPVQQPPQPGAFLPTSRGSKREGGTIHGPGQQQEGLYPPAAFKRSRADVAPYDVPVGYPTSGYPYGQGQYGVPLPRAYSCAPFGMQYDMSGPMGMPMPLSHSANHAAFVHGHAMGMAAWSAGMAVGNGNGLGMRMPVAPVATQWLQRQSLEHQELDGIRGAMHNGRNAAELTPVLSVAATVT